MAEPANGVERAAKLLGELIKENKDSSIQAKLKECYRLVNGLGDYLEETAEPETPLQERIGNDTFSDRSLPFMLASGFVEGQFLKLAAQMTKAKRILEIGMFTGYGAVSFSESKYCEEMVCLDMEPYLKTFIEQRVADTPVKDKLRVVVGKALDSLKILKNEGKQFDLVFIDADKGNYINYYKFIMDNGMLSPEGTILIDNALWFAETYPTPSTPTGRAIYDFNRYVKADPRVNQVIVPINDGVMIIHRKDDKLDS